MVSTNLFPLLLPVIPETQDGQTQVIDQTVGNVFILIACIRMIVRRSINIDRDTPVGIIEVSARVARSNHLLRGIGQEKITGIDEIEPFLFQFTIAGLLLRQSPQAV